MDRIIGVETRKIDKRAVVAVDVDEVIVRTPAGYFSISVDNSGRTHLRVLHGQILICPVGGNTIQIAQTMDVDWDKTKEQKSNE